MDRRTEYFADFEIQNVTNVAPTALPPVLRTCIIIKRNIFLRNWSIVAEVQRALIIKVFLNSIIILVT